MNDFLKWAFHHNTPDWIGMFMVFVFFIGAMSWLLFSIWLLLSGSAFKGAVLFLFPLIVGARIVWLEYRTAREATK